MAWEKVSDFGEYVTFDNCGDNIEGVCKGTSEGNTQYGTAEFCKIKGDNNKMYSFVVTSGMRVDFDSMVGKKIMVEYLGKKVNDKTGREYKAFDVFIDDTFQDKDNPPF